MKRAFQFISAIILTLSTGVAALSQSSYTAQEATEDYEFLIKQIQTYNPALEIYNPDFVAKSNQLISATPEEVNAFDHFKTISKIAALSNEGHFLLGNWEDEVHLPIVEDRLPYLPFEVWVIDKRLLIRLDLTNEGAFTPGDEIVQINGKPSEEILNELYECYPSDGDIVTYQRAKIESNFAWMYTLYISQDPNLELEIKKSNDSAVRTVQTAALVRTVRLENYRKRYPDRANSNQEESIQDFYELEITNGLATLKLKTFDFRFIEKYELKAPKFYEDIFKKVHESEVSTLLVDLRGNTGGRNEFADQMIPFILQSEGDELLKTTTSWEGKVRKYAFPKKDKFAFGGAIFLLVDGETYSAGASLARYLKEYGKAIVIGEETGTRYEGFVAGSTQLVTLPASGIKIGMPRYHIQYPDSKQQETQNRGLIPDYTVSKNLDDLLGEFDPVLDKALSLIKANKKP
ncbi:S41 family peptidase [Algoriphagus halophytocola]|uniref:S41 family peptidase n=1 Tax=Algoriphagus halophytocola TaxID=2991499 RepID=A0ABY6MFC3_9BACT|nr:S41 family peptidase [Algoriphagus sp. TR-M5]UZD22487.1 S41 family peptidase [Algoriphagus sp. TR-M5]